MKTFAIPDLHGRFDLLQKAYEIFYGYADDEDHPIGDIIVHLGDYVDRGPDSRRVLEFLMNPETMPLGMKRVILKGNHEKVMSDSLRGRLEPEWWISRSNGGAATMVSYGHPPIDIEEPIIQPGFVPAAVLDWIDDLPLVHADAHRVYVHAYVDPEMSLPEQDEEVVLWGRYSRINEGGYRGAHVVHGHDSHSGGPLLLSGRTNLDVNAWHSGRLTVGVFDNEKPGGPVDILEVTDG